MILNASVACTVNAPALCAVLGESDACCTAVSVFSLLYCSYCRSQLFDICDCVHQLVRAFVCCLCF